METHEAEGDYWGLMRLRETQRDSRDSGRLLGTYETQKDYCRLMRLLILIKTEGDS